MSLEGPHPRWRSRWRQAEFFREKAKLGARVARALTGRRSDTMPFAAACDQQDRPGRGVGLLQRRGKLARLRLLAPAACASRHGLPGRAAHHRRERSARRVVAVARLGHNHGARNSSQ